MLTIARAEVQAMLIEFDHNTMANKTAALAYVCKRIPADKGQLRDAQADSGRDDRMRALQMA